MLWELYLEEARQAGEVYKHGMPDFFLLALEIPEYLQLRFN